ncbi:hypothetical protein ACLOJK_040169 [Asimina triloba]
MEAAGGLSNGHGTADVDETYRRLPSLYLGLLAFWFTAAFSWTFNTWKKRHFQLARNVDTVLLKGSKPYVCVLNAEAKLDGE